MIRHRLASVAFAASLALLQGCSGCGFGHGQLMSRFGRHDACECSNAGPGILVNGNGPGYDGPLLEPPGVISTEPPIAPPPRPYMPPQAQPDPAPPVSRVKPANTVQK